MKKSITCIFLFFFLISFASAFYIEPVLFMQKRDYQPGETFIARLDGNIVQNLTASNFKFYEGKREISLVYDKINYQGTYYIYIYFEKEGNFTIKLQNILYKDSTLKSKTITENITVLKRGVNGTSQILSIKPGFVYGTEKPRLTLTNKGSSPLDVSYSGQKISLQPLESRNIFPTAVLGISTLTIDSYEKFEVPIILLSGLVSNQTPINQTQANATKNNTKNETIFPSYNPLLVFPSSFKVNSTESISLIKTLQLTNIGNIEITNLQLISLNPSLSVSKLEQTLLPNKNVTLNLTFLSVLPGFFSGNISLTYEFNKIEYSKIITFQFYSFQKQVQTQPVEKKNCQALNGNICVNQKCTGNYTFTQAGEYCCLGTCVAIATEPGSSGSKWIAGIVLFIILGVIGYLAWKKYKKTKPSTPKEEIQKKSGLFEKRIQGGLARS